MPAPSPRSSRLVLVTGANGFIGGRVATLLLDRGVRVRTLTRQDWAGEPWVPVADRMFGALPHDVPSDCLDGVESVVHCAALTGAGSEALAQAVNVDGTLALARRAAAAGARRFVFLSSQSARSDAAAAYGRTKHEAEQALLGMSGIEAIVLRPGLVIGPGGAGLFGRMRETVRRLPVIPLLGGGTAPVQPIHVDDLGEAILRCLDGAVPGGTILRLGDPAGLPLRELLARLAVAATGRSKLAVPIPLAPVMLVARAAEAVRLPLPVTTANLRGLKAVEIMDTAPDLARLGLTLRPLDSALSESRRESSVPGLDRRPVGIILVGGGRIGLLHAITAMRSRGAALLAVVDPSPRARGLLKSLGVRTRFLSSLDEALGLPGADAAIVATPPATHLPLATRCLQAGLDVLVEKPLAVKRSELAAFESLGARFPGRSIQVGYLAPRYPQAEAAIEALRGGELGRVTGYRGFTLLTFITRPSASRWETRKEISGGGVLANAGGHVLSLVRAAFGDPVSVRMTPSRIVSAEVEDAAIVELRHEGFTGTCHASWTIAGFPRQENRLVVDTDRGTLTITNESAVFESSGGDVRAWRQLDADVGFNLFPDYAGGGISAEQRDLQLAARGVAKPPMDLAAGLGVERLLFDVYDAPSASSGSPRSSPSPAPLAAAPEAATRPQAGPSAAITRAAQVDLAGVPGPDVKAFLAGARGAAWGGAVLLPAQLHDALGSGTESRRLAVVVPDFGSDARRLAGGQAVGLLKEWGPAGVFGAGLAATTAALKDLGPGFWMIAEALLGASLMRVPGDFAGTLLLDPYLTDLALAVGRPDRVGRMLARMRSRAPRARIGIRTNLLVESRTLASAGVAPDAIHFLSSPAGRGLPEAVAGWRAAPHAPRLAAEVGPGPAALHRDALRRPEAWMHGADVLTVGLAADPELARARRRALESAWSHGLPGQPYPGGLE